MGQGDEQVGLRKRRSQGVRKERKRRKKRKRQDGAGARERWGGTGDREEKEKAKKKGKELQCKKASRKMREKREKLTQPFLSAAPSLWSKVEMRNKSLLW